MREVAEVNSLGFPKMFKGNSTTVCEGNEAVRHDMHLLLSSESGEFLFDPDWGIRLKRYTFSQNNYVLKDILIDELYTKITTFFPQLTLSRKDITITQRGTALYATIYAKNMLSFTTDMYSLKLFEEEGEE